MNYKDTVLGIEFGSTRIKAVLLDRELHTVAQGVFDWENSLIDGIWTYSLDEAVNGLQKCYADLVSNLGEAPEEYGAIGISGMMHGYLPFDADGNQLAEFRTWRNTITRQAVEELSPLFDFAVPQRWSIAHLRQAILNGEEHVKDISFLTTLAGYMHYLLTGEKCAGIGEASGMFPIDSDTLDYDSVMADKFDEISGMPWKIRDILPKVLCAGDEAGRLTEEGAKLIDVSGNLKPGIPFAPCEGDAGTGMVATNAVRVRTGNVSAGTSDFAMIVADKKLALHKEISMVTTPDGLPVAMVHCSNCTSDINAWVSLFGQFAEAIGAPQDKGALFTMLFNKALEGDPDCGGLLSYNYYSGEGVTGLDEGRPVFARRPDSSFTLENFMRTHLLSALATLKIGLDILTKEENIRIDRICGHGGYFKTPGVGQRMLSAAIGAPVTVMETSGEGGPYGMALLCAYMLQREDGETLPDFLDGKVFAKTKSSTLMADEKDIEGFNAFLERYVASFDMEKTAVDTM